MKNPISIYDSNNNIVEFGDPFILRFNGKYYLYPSSNEQMDYMHCFVSTDLIHWSKPHIIATGKLFNNAYAPEVIYNDGYFYLCTSPSGRGHYILKSTSPLGPFSPITGNIHNMIDGSFALDKDFILKLFRANHYGISVVDLDENFNPNHRRNLQAFMNGWTEGPMALYRNGYYYLTYCGNHLLSSAYRVYYSVSKELDRNYQQSMYNPLLIRTDKDYNSLGHSSNFLAPDLDGYYIAYHYLQINNGVIHRDFGIDRLHFNGPFMATYPTNFEIDNPKMPDLFEDLSNSTNKFSYINLKLLSNESTKKVFTAEFNFKRNNNRIILSYINEEKYDYIYLNDKSIIIVINNKKVFEKTLNISFNNFHTLRVINGKNSAEILIDNVSIGFIETFNCGKIGYQTENSEGLYFTAFTNSANGSSDIKYHNPIPNTLSCLLDINNNEKSKDMYDEILFSSLNANQEATFKVLSKEKEKYVLNLLVSNNTKCELEISSNNDKVSISIDKNNSEYGYYYKKLGELTILEKDEITIRVISGLLEYKLLDIAKEDIYFENVKSYQDETIHFEKNLSSTQEIIFNYESFEVDSLFGMIFNANNYSSHPCNPTPSFEGFIVGFRNDLLVVEEVCFGLKRVYDVPLPIKLHQDVKLQATIKDQKVQVYVDDIMYINTSLENKYPYGYGGYYKNKNAKVTLKINTKENIDE